MSSTAMRLPLAISSVLDTVMMPQSILVNEEPNTRKYMRNEMANTINIATPVSAAGSVSPAAYSASRIGFSYMR